MERQNNYSLFSDKHLLSLLKDRDHAAYTELYTRYYYLVFVFCYKKLRNIEQAKDIIQDLFIDLWAKKEITLSNDKLVGYLMVSARNRIFNYLEHEQVKNRHLESLSAFCNTGNLGHTDFLARENQMKAYIESSIQALPKKMRRIFEMSRKENLSNKKIAESLNTTESNVSQHLSNATKILRTKLGSILFFPLL